MRIPSLLFLILFCGALNLNAQKPGMQMPQGTAGKDYNLLDAQGRKTGVWIRVYKDQPEVMYYKGQFIAGVPAGVFEFYSTSGDRQSVVNHVQDTTINDVTIFYPGGLKVMSQGRYIGSLREGKWVRQKDGLWKSYDSNEVLRSEENYVFGELDGLCKYSYSNSKLVAAYQYKRGIRQGPFTTYYDNGKKEKEGNYLGDELDGEFMSWRENGTLESEGSYVKGLKDGTWFYYNTSGEPEVTVLYKLGKEIKRRNENGTFTEYYENGIPKSEYSYENGKRNGPFREWFDVGQFVQVPGSREDIEAGIMVREKLEGAQIKVEGDYLEDHPEGELIYYSTNGRIEKIETWEGGVLISTRKVGN
jgi:antitoxin component YwqK of YwqJK toxin-antitoxin module